MSEVYFNRKDPDRFLYISYTDNTTLSNEQDHSLNSIYLPKFHSFKSCINYFSIENESSNFINWNIIFKVNIFN